jgi:hypothetical protein
MKELTELRALVKTYYDFQLMRIRIDNRLKRRKDGTTQKISDKVNKEVIVDTTGLNKTALEEIAEQTIIYEQNILKMIQKKVREEPLWEVFFKGVKGCGELMSAVCMSEFDVYKANTVSKFYAFAGISPGQTFGKKWNKDKTEIVITDVLVRQDKKTPGFLCPYNQWLRSKLIGVLAGSFLKCNSPYRKYYDDRRHRLEQMEWGEKSKNPSKKDNPRAGHQNNAAKRYMIKMFLLDLYVAWRTLEGLEIRPPYEEEYLGKKHSE